MARYMTHPAKRSLLAGGVVAGFVGALLLHAFEIAIGLAHFPQTYQLIASAMLGHIAFGEGMAWIGVIVAFAVCIVAAAFYAYVAQITGLMGKPIIGGALFGIAANAVVDLLTYAKWGTPLPTTWHDVALPLVAYVVFFGVPVALVLSRYERVPIPYA